MDIRPVDLLQKPAGWKFSRADAVKFQCCAKCGNPFDHTNIRSPQEKAESRISGLCGLCWDKLFPEEE